MEQVEQQNPAALRARLEFPIWHRSFARAYAAWSSAPGDLKAPLLLSGPALAKAESWLLACPERLSDSEKRYIVRSISQRARTSPLTSKPGGKSAVRIRSRRASDRSLWQLYAVIAVGLWVFAPDYIKQAMETALNKPGLEEPSQTGPMVIATPNAKRADEEAAQSPADITPAPHTGQAEIADAGSRPSGNDEPAPGEAAAPAAVEPPTPGPVPPPPSSRSARLAELAREQLNAGRQRHALLLAMESLEVARAEGSANEDAVRSAASALHRAMATRTPLAPLSTKVMTATTAMFCDGAKGVLAATADARLAAWQLLPSAGRMQSHGAWEGSLTGVAMDRDCRRLVTGDEDFNVEIRPIGGGAALAKLIGHEAGIVAAQFSPDGNTLLTASEDGTARIWDMRTGRQRALLSGHEWQLTAAGFSPDGRRVVTAAADRTARIWDATSGRELLILDGHKGVVASASFSPIGTIVMTTSWDGQVRLWNAATGRLERSLQRQGGALLKAWISPDGRRIATVSEGEMAQIWDAASGERMADVAIKDRKVQSLLFSPSGQWLAALTWDGEVSLHVAETGHLVTQLGGRGDHVRALAFGQGPSLHGITEAGTHLTWPIAETTEALLAQARSTAPACLSIDERLLLGLETELPGWCKDLPMRGAILPR